MDNNNFMNMDDLFGDGPSVTPQAPVPEQAPEVQVNPEQVLQGTRVKKKTSEQAKPVVQQQPATRYDYTPQEWEQKRNTYIQEIENLSDCIDPTDVNPATISMAAYEIDRILTPLKIDHMFALEKSDFYEGIMKRRKERLFTVAKANLTSTQTKPPTVDDTKSEVINILESDKAYDGLNIFDAFEKYSLRATETKVLIGILMDKKDMLITFAAALKADVSINNLSAPVPNNNTGKRF